MQVRRLSLQAGQVTRQRQKEAPQKSNSHADFSLLRRQPFQVSRGHLVRQGLSHHRDQFLSFDNICAVAYVTSEQYYPVNTASRRRAQATPVPYPDS